MYDCSLFTRIFNLINIFLVKVGIYSKRSQASSFRDTKGEEWGQWMLLQTMVGLFASPSWKGMWPSHEAFVSYQGRKQSSVQVEFGSGWRLGGQNPQESFLLLVTMDIYILSHVCYLPSCCASLNFICNTVDPISLSWGKSVTHVLWDTETPWFVTWPWMLLLKKKGCKVVCSENSSWIFAFHRDSRLVHTQ